MDLIEQGKQQGIIRLEEGDKYIVYMHQGKRRNYENPEERAQAQAFLNLVLTYRYPVERIRQFVSVQMGSDTKEADIIVYDDNAQKSPLIVVECKKPDVSEMEFVRATDQAFSYAVAEGAKYVWVTSGIKDVYYEVSQGRSKARITIPDIPQFGVKQIAQFKFAYKGGTTTTGQKLFPLEKMSEDELTRRFQQAHQALWGGGELNPSEAFDELGKLIFCKLWDERKPRKAGVAYDFQIISVKPVDDTDEARRKAEQETNDGLLARIRGLYEEGRRRDSEVFKDSIRLNASKVRTVVSYLESVNFSETDLDSKGRAFETFLGSYFRGDFGQFFTPRAIVQFIVDVLPITHESLILDTSCGSGGFLLHALDKVRREAEVYYPDHDTDPREASLYREHWHNFAEHNLYGIEISEQIARTAKMNMIIHDDGHTNVAAFDGLVPADEIAAATDNKGFAYDRFDFIITNPPFGSTVRQTEKAYLHQYRFATREMDWLNPKSARGERPNQDTEVLFIEQCHQYLKAGGYLAIVIPDSILTNSSLQYVRDGIEELFRIVAVVSLPQTAFTATGAGVKSSVLFLRKYSAAETKRVQDTKQALKDSIREGEKFAEQLASLERNKKKEIDRLLGTAKQDKLPIAEIKQSEAYKELSREISERYAAETEQLRYRLEEIYQERRRNGLPDYEIFMAIAEDIGYDGTGRKTKANELNIIKVDLAGYIKAIEEGRA